MFKKKEDKRQEKKLTYHSKIAFVNILVDILQYFFICIYLLTRLSFLR